MGSQPPVSRDLTPPLPVPPYHPPSPPFLSPSSGPSTSRCFIFYLLARVSLSIPFFPTRHHRLGLNLRTCDRLTASVALSAMLTSLPVLPRFRFCVSPPASAATLAAAGRNVPDAVSCGGRDAAAAATTPTVRQKPSWLQHKMSRGNSSMKTSAAWDFKGRRDEKTSV